MAPAMLHVFSDLSALASDADIKEAILTNYSDIPSTTEAATRLQNIQFSMNEPLVTFNHRYEAIHKVAFRMSPSEHPSLNFTFLLRERVLLRFSLNYVLLNPTPGK